MPGIAVELSEVLTAEWEAPTSTPPRDKCLACGLQWFGIFHKFISVQGETHQQVLSHVIKANNAQQCTVLWNGLLSAFRDSLILAQGNLELSILSPHMEVALKTEKMSFSNHWSFCEPQIIDLFVNLRVALVRWQACVNFNCGWHKLLLTSFHKLSINRRQCEEGAFKITSFSLFEILGIEPEALCWAGMPPLRHIADPLNPIDTIAHCVN